MYNSALPDVSETGDTSVLHILYNMIGGKFSGAQEQWLVPAS